MSHISRQLESKTLPSDHKRSITFKFLTKRMYSAIRRANRMKLPPPVSLALQAANAVQGVLYIKNNCNQ